MGIIINDSIIYPNGQDISHTYASFGNEVVRITKEVSNSVANYICACYVQIFVSQNAKDTGCLNLTSFNVSTTLNASDLNSNLYEKLYTELKKKYESTQDVI